MAAESSRVLRPVILLGAPRSGTSLLAGLLEAHPDVALLREPRLIWRYGNDRHSDQLRPRHATPEVIDHIHQSFGAILAARGVTRVVEKTPANSLRPWFVDAVFPDACYVHITRNGWAAVPAIRAFWERRATGVDARQLRKAGRRFSESSPRQWRHYVREAVRRVGGGRATPLYGPRLAGLQDVVDELGQLEAAALQWRACVDQVTAFGRAMEPERYTEIKLEALDVATLESVLDICGLRRASQVLDRWSVQYQQALATRREPLGAEERQMIASYVEPANAWLGYPAASPVEATAR